MIFKLEGKIIFEAENLDDAFDKLISHFNDLKNNKEESSTLPGTDIHLEEMIEYGKISKCCGEPVGYLDLDNGERCWYCTKCRKSCLVIQE